MADINLKRGYRLRLEGEPFRVFENAHFPYLVASKPVDFIGLKPKLEVAQGDKVKVGTVLYRDKNNESICFTSSASGVVKEIVRGDRRGIEAVGMETDGEQLWE